MRDNLFRIFYNGEWIGSSDLEIGDPPMGVAMGRFFPEPCYFEYQAIFQKLWDESQDHLEIVTIQPSGEKLPASATRIDDHPEIETSAISVRVFGIDAGLYKELFPGHWDAHDNSFKS